MAKSGHVKNEHAVILGRAGGKVGGPARARKLSHPVKSKIASNAAKARWAHTAHSRANTKTVKRQAKARVRKS
jgi:hypothetical protein